MRTMQMHIDANARLAAFFARGDPGPIKRLGPSTEQKPARPTQHPTLSSVRAQRQKQISKLGCKSKLAASLAIKNQRHKKDGKAETKTVQMQIDANARLAAFLARGDPGPIKRLGPTTEQKPVRPTQHGSSRSFACLNVTADGNCFWYAIECCLAKGALSKAKEWSEGRRLKTLAFKYYREHPRIHRIVGWEARQSCAGPRRL
jgi:hypothetical protein